MLTIYVQPHQQLRRQPHYRRHNGPVGQSGQPAQNRVVWGNKLENVNAIRIIRTEVIAMEKVRVITKQNVTSKNHFINESIITVISYTEIKLSFIHLK